MKKIKAPTLFVLTRNEIENYISDNDLKEGDLLPSEAQLCKIFGISRGTLREAMRVLEEEGVVIRKQGVGTFISKNKTFIRSTLDRNEGVTEMILGKGMIPGSKLKEIKTIKANEKLAKKLQISLGESLFVISRVRTADEIPIAYTTDYLPYSLTSGEFPINFVQESLYNYLEEKLNIKIYNSLLFIEPISLPKSISTVLDVKSGTLSLLLKQTDSDVNNRSVLYSEEYFIFNRFEFVVFRRSIDKYVDNPSSKDESNKLHITPHASVLSRDILVQS